MARSNAELVFEGAVEIRKIAEAGIERDFRYIALFGQEPHGCAAQSGAQKVLVRCDAGEGLKSAEKVMRTQSRDAGQRCQIRGSGGLVLDSSNDARYARERPRVTADVLSSGSAFERQHVSRKLNREFLASALFRGDKQRRRAGGQRGGCANGREARVAKAGAV